MVKKIISTHKTKALNCFHPIEEKKNIVRRCQTHLFFYKNIL